MLDEKKIEEAARKRLYAFRKANPDGYSSSIIDIESDCLDNFKAGAHWAIQEFLKDLLHPASEEPRNDFSDILVIRKLHRPATISPQLMLEDIEDDNTSYKDEWNKVCDELQIKKYFYIDDLIEQKGGE